MRTIIVNEGFFSDTFFVCNRNTNELEQTDGDGFKDWWLKKDRDTTHHRLVKSARLLKYLRDTKTTFSCKSILLTTLIGNQVSIWDEYPDVPTTLLRVLSGIDNFLQANPEMPDIRNPVLSTESFTRNWTQPQYATFRTVMHRYRGWVEEAYNETNRDESIRKWRRVFGDQFAKDVIVERASNAALLTELATGDNRTDPIAALRTFGQRILARFPARLPHMEVHSLSENISLDIQIRAFLKSDEKTARIRQIESAEILEPGKWLEFEAINRMGMPFPKADFRVEWLVVNTGDVAQSQDALRGRYEQSQNHGVRREHTDFHGIHFVEAIVIDKRRNHIVGRSDRFFVVIDNSQA